MFEVSGGEALLALSGVDRLLPAEQVEVTARARRIVQETAASFPGDSASGLLDPRRSEDEDDRYFELLVDRACPMLELSSGRCRIYETRPLTCRTFGLAWIRDEEVLHPPCPMNLPTASEDATRRAGIDLGETAEAEEAFETVAMETGLPRGAETTLAHAIVGSAFQERSRGPGLVPCAAAVRIAAAISGRVPDHARRPARSRRVPG
jgi:Fe-S-cluster containining protein